MFNRANWASSNFTCLIVRSAALISDTLFTRSILFGKISNSGHPLSLPIPPIDGRWSIDFIASSMPGTVVGCIIPDLNSGIVFVEASNDG
jgi:hypothetical protein